MASPYIQDVHEWINYYKKGHNRKDTVEGGGGLASATTKVVANPVKKPGPIHTNTNMYGVEVISPAQQAVVQARAAQRKKPYKKRKPVKRAVRRKNTSKQGKPSKKKKKPVARRKKRQEREICLIHNGVTSSCKCTGNIA